MAKEMKWSQWSYAYGMERCGVNDYNTIMAWMRDYGLDAKKELSRQDKPHAVYGMTVHKDGELVEIRFYREAFKTDDELDEIARKFPGETIYACHK